MALINEHWGGLGMGEHRWLFNVRTWHRFRFGAPLLES